MNDVDHWHWLTRNIEHNERLTFDDYVLAAQEGDSHAQRYLMYVYCNKMLLTRNDKLCVFWAERLVAKNDIEGMLMLAGAYMNARGVQKDYNAARELLQNLLSISPDTISAKFLLAEIETREKNST